MTNTTVLAAQHVSKYYPAKNRDEAPIEVLKRVDFTLSAGETLAIVGSSGSGKSTLLSLLAGLDVASAGKITLAGVDLATLSEDALAHHRARHLGMVFQRFHLLPHLSAQENIMLPLDLLGQKQAKVQAQAVLDQVRLSHRADHFPSQLSGGECQRIAIARALVTKPALVLADEPTGNLDDDHAERIANLLFDCVRETQLALILVTHNQGLSKQCSRILQLHNGVLTKDN